LIAGRYNIGVAKLNSNKICINVKSISFPSRTFSIGAYLVLSFTLCQLLIHPIGHKKEDPSTDPTSIGEKQNRFEQLRKEKLNNKTSEKSWATKR